MTSEEGQRGDPRYAYLFGSLHGNRIETNPASLFVQEADWEAIDQPSFQKPLRGSVQVWCGLPRSTRPTRASNQG